MEQNNLGTTLVQDELAQSTSSFNIMPDRNLDTAKRREAPLVLLVEDNILALHLIETIAAQAGCRTLSAIDGEKGLDLAKTTAFDLIITDIGLPDISGIELTQLIREWERAMQKKPVPIVGLTAQTLDEAEHTGLQAGMNQVMSKPIYLQEIQELVDRLVIQEKEAQEEEHILLSNEQY